MRVFTLHRPPHRAIVTSVLPAQSDGATAAVTLKLMSRDIEKNGSDGGAMSIDEAIGEHSPALLCRP